MPPFSVNVELLSRRTRTNPEPVEKRLALHSSIKPEGSIYPDRTLLLSGEITKVTGQTVFEYINLVTRKSDDAELCHVEARFVAPLGPTKGKTNAYTICSSSTVKVYANIGKEPGEPDAEIALGRTGKRLRVNIEFDKPICLNQKIELR